VVGSPRFWRDYYERYKSDFEATEVSSYDALLLSPTREKIAEQVAQNDTPWLVCEQCIHLFDVDQKQARVYTRHWWESRWKFVPPGSGPAPLSEVRMGEVTTTPPPSPRGVPRWPPVVALLNLTGLNLGYLYMRRWLRWLVSSLLMASLVTAAFLTDAARLPSQWAAIFGVWLLWTFVDGWIQARRLVQAAPAGAADKKRAIGRRWPSVIITALLIGLVAAGLWGYVTLGQREFAAGMETYRAADCRIAIQHFNRITTIYELTLSPNVATADANIIECSLLIVPENARAQGEYANAVVGYDAYLHHYPESVLLPFAQETIAETYAEWATHLREEEDYQTAIENYQIVLSEYPDTSAGAEAAAQVAEIYAEWATVLRAAGEYDATIEKYQIVLNEYPDTPTGEEAAALAAETYCEWAANLREKGECEEAITRYQIVLDQYPDTPTAAEAVEAIAKVYTEWAVQLREAGDYEVALERYWIILDEYPDTTAAAEAEEATAETYLEWAAQLREADLYLAAIGKYQTVASKYPDTEAASSVQIEIGWTYNDWGKYLHSQRKYIEAMQKFTEASEATSDPDAIAAAEAGYEEALWGLSQDTSSDGRQVMEQALAEVCDGDPASSPAVGLAEDEPSKALFDGSEFTLPSDLRATSPGHFRYAVCLETGTSVVERCPYTGGHTLVRQRRWWRVNVYDTLTARRVTYSTFYGSWPAACPFSRVFSSSTDYWTGDHPSADPVITWLQGVVR